MRSFCAVLLRALALLVCFTAFVQGAQTLQLSDLPQNPPVDCKSPAVQSAFISCRLYGVSTQCCEAVDSAFWSRISPAAGCLCLPPVLHKVVEVASKSNVDVLAILEKCKQQHGMQTDWAIRRNTTCPNVKFNAMQPPTNSSTANASATTADLPETSADVDVPLFGATRPMWSWQNLLQAGDLQAQPDMLMAAATGTVMGLHSLMYTILCFTCIAPFYLILHNFVLLKYSKAYRGMESGQQLVSCQHAVYFVVYAILLIPQNVLAIRCCFRAWTAAYVSGQEMTVMYGCLVMTRALLYVVEACVRSIVRPSWLLLVHHHLYFLVLITATWIVNAPAIMIGLVLDWMACHEVFLYLALLAYRLKWRKALAVKILWFACAWYVLTRIFQTALLVYMIVGWANQPAVNRTVPYLLAAVLCGAFTIIQAYTLVIYKGIWVKLCKKSSASLAVAVGHVLTPK